MRSALNTPLITPPPFPPCLNLRPPHPTPGSEPQRPASIIEKARVEVPGVGSYDTQQALRDRGPAAVIGTEDQRPPDTIDKYFHSPVPPRLFA